mmetsp:Transcript_27707/g.45034  ORF Transcript_27707/g.45034 Transcript_27707/m.45034 type:complete len:113 (-) Transcript_27707:768-1106(-)
MGAEALNVMDTKDVPRFDDFRDALQSVGAGEWVYTGFIDVGSKFRSAAMNGHCLSLDGDIVAARTGNSSLLVVSGLLSRRYQYTRVELHQTLSCTRIYSTFQEWESAVCTRI